MRKRNHIKRKTMKLSKIDKDINDIEEELLKIIPSQEYQKVCFLFYQMISLKNCKRSIIGQLRNIKE